MDHPGTTVEARRGQARRDDLRTADVWDLRSALSRLGRVTVPRLLCLRVLGTSAGHLTNREILDRVAPDLPGIRLSTVYRTMSLFIESGVAHRIDSHNGSRHGVGAGHAHAICPRCDLVEDLHTIEPGVAVPLGLPADSAPILNLTVQRLCVTCAAAPLSGVLT